jgi:hypothetical protein
MGLSNVGEIGVVQRYLHLSEGICNRVKEFACTSGRENYAVSSVAAGKATYAGQVLSEVPDKERYLGLPGLGLGVGLYLTP